MGDRGRSWQRRPQQRREYQQRGAGSYVNGGRDGREEPAPCTPSSSRRPPPSGGWQRSGPSWEKDFCYCVGIPWRKVMEAKELMSVYKNIIQWDDSAGEEAFHNAKMRFWAWRNHLPCDIPLPDPDMYNDHIDWNWKIDPELIRDLEKKPPPSLDEDQSNSNKERSGWDSCRANEPIMATGWGDAGDSCRNLPAATGWEDPDRKNGNNLHSGWSPIRKNGNDLYSGWGRNSGGWGDANINESEVNHGKAWRVPENNSCRENPQVLRQTWHADPDNDFSDSRKNGKKREGIGYGWYNSRNARSRYNGRDASRVQDGSNYWRNFGGAVG